MSSEPRRVRCTQLTKAGRPCRRWAVRDTEPPTCYSHLRAGSAGGTLEQVRPGGGQRGGEEGFYSPMLSPDELADLVAYAAELTLADEIACTRVAMRRTLEFLSQGRGSLSESDYLRAAGLVFQGARTMARLLREQQRLLGDSGDRLTAIFDAALDGLSEEWGIEL